MLPEPAFTETELALRWNISIKTLQRWRSEERGPPYIKLSKAVRYPVDEIIAYELAIRQGMPNDTPLPSLADIQPVVELRSVVNGRVQRLKRLSAFHNVVA